MTAKITLGGWKFAVQAALQKRIAIIVEEEACKAAINVRARVIEEAANLSVNLVEQADNYNFKPEVSIVLYDKAAP